jgi:2-dehydro-3-deoxyphosphogluconate aldolase/(4S)-4-hydroxy-2-oxoglutarate aldolase
MIANRASDHSGSGVADRLRAAGVVPVVEIEDPARAVAVAQALETGGLPIVEVTFRTEAAAAALRRIARDAPRVFLIAGTVTSTHLADIALDAGAMMLVAPGLNPSVVEHAGRIGLPMMPGVCTPSEVERALSLGLTAVKLFPIEPIGGIRYLRALMAPYPAMTWIPTGGISLATLPEYLGIKTVLACGGSWIAPRAEIDAGRFEGIAARAAAAAEVVRRVRAAFDASTQPPSKATPGGES